jgi:hypothetical protein
MIAPVFEDNVANVTDQAGGKVRDILTAASTICGWRFARRHIRHRPVIIGIFEADGMCPGAATTNSL